MRVSLYLVCSLKDESLDDDMDYNLHNHYHHHLDGYPIYFMISKIMIN